MSDEYSERLCDEKHQNIWAAITDLRDQIKSLKKAVAVFNTTGIGILVSMVTSLIINQFGGK